MPNDYEKCSDAQLVQCYQTGDTKAGNALCQRYWIILYKFFKKRIRGNSEEDVKDLVQETFYEALKTLKNLRSPTSFQAWLYKIARRVLRSWINVQQKQTPFMSQEDVPEDELEQTSLVEFFLAPTGYQPEHETIDNEFRHIRLRFEQTLQPKELMIFRLRHHGGKTFKEIGAELGIKPGTARVRYYRAVQAFRRWLEKHYPDTYFLLSGGGVNSWTNSYWLFSSFGYNGTK